MYCFLVSGSWNKNGSCPEREGIFALDNVDCYGNESSLLDCQHSGLKIHDCIPGEAAQIECSKGVSFIIKHHNHALFLMHKSQ